MNIPKKFYDLGGGSRLPKTMTHHIGVEIEFISQYPEDVIKYELLNEGIDENCCLGDDGSIHEPLDYRGYELRILATIFTYRRILAKVQRVLDKVQAKVNNSCGLHVHLDMRRRDPEKCFNNLRHFERLMFQMIPAKRRNNEFCRPTKQSYVYGPSKWDRDGRFLGYSHRPPETFAEWRQASSHYDAISLDRLNEYKTIEVRLHEGTTDMTEVTNWVTFLNLIVNAPPLTGATDLRLPKAIKTYMQSRIAKFNRSAA